MTLKWLETNLFFETPLEKPYGVWIEFWQWASNHSLYTNYIVLPNFQWGIVTDDTTFHREDENGNNIQER